MALSSAQCFTFAAWLKMAAAKAGEMGPDLVSQTTMTPSAPPSASASPSVPTTTSTPPASAAPPSASLPAYSRP